MLQQQHPFYYYNHFPLITFQNCSIVHYCLILRQTSNVMTQFLALDFNITQYCYYSGRFPNMRVCCYCTGDVVVQKPEIVSPEAQTGTHRTYCRLSTTGMSILFNGVWRWGIVKDISYLQYPIYVTICFGRLKSLYITKISIVSLL